MTMLPLLTWLHEKTQPPVLAPAPFVLLGTLRPLFAIAQNGDPALIDAVRDEIHHRGLRAALAEIHVELILVTRGPAIVGMPLDQDKVGWMGAQPRRVHVQDLHVLRPDHGFSEVEVNVAQLGDRIIVPRPRQTDGTSRTGGRSQRRCRGALPLPADA